MLAVDHTRVICVTFSLSVRSLPAFAQGYGAAGAVFAGSG
jgi:hypothetical protein